MPPIAGIGIIHDVEHEIELDPLMPGSEWSSHVRPQEAILIRHVVGDTSIEGATAILEIGTHASYYDVGGDGIAVVMTDLVPGVERVVLRTVRAGYEYEMRYASAPAHRVPRNISEIPAYALALAARRAGLLAHGCAFVMPSGRAALCLGVSGAGKSTLARMMHSVPGVRVLNDDRIVLADRGDGMRAWSTPWPGRAGVAEPGNAPLGAIAIIGRGPNPLLRRLSSRATTAALLQTLAVPVWNTEDAGCALDRIATVQQSIPIVQIEYPLSEAAATWILETLEAISS